MKFLSQDVERCAQVFSRGSFGEARRSVVDVLSKRPAPTVQLEGQTLLFRTNVERDDPAEVQQIGLLAQGCVDEAITLKHSAASYQLGIVLILYDALDDAQRCFNQYLIWNDPKDRLFGQYGLATVDYNRKEYDACLRAIRKLQKADPPQDLLCLSLLLQSHCERSQQKLNQALTTLQSAQKILPNVESHYLKNWVFFGLASVYARLGDSLRAKTLFEIVLALTHPTDFKRLYRLSNDELLRLGLQVGVLFDPSTGDLVSDRGCISLRRKPILTKILTKLISTAPAALSKEHLYQSVWKTEYHPLRHDGLIYSHMQRLRQELACDSRLKDFIITTEAGYQLNSNIKATIKARSLPRSIQKEISNA